MCKSRPSKLARLQVPKRRDCPANEGYHPVLHATPPYRSDSTRKYAPGYVKATLSIGPPGGARPSRNPARRLSQRPRAAAWIEGPGATRIILS